MAGGWPLAPVFGAGFNFGVSTANSAGAPLTSGAANVKGAWVQISNGIASDITRLVLYIDLTPIASGQAVLDVSSGGAGVETSGFIIQNLVVATSGDLCVTLELPVNLKLGTAVSVRFASPTATDSIRVCAAGYHSGYTESLNSGLYDTYGYSGSGTITGVAVDPGATANTKGTYAQLTASTSNDLAGFFLGFDLQNGAFVTALNCPTLFDLAIGASGSESVVVSNLALGKITGSGFAAFGPHFSPIVWMPVPAGTRFAARAQCAITTSGIYRQNGVSLYGIRT